MSRLLLENSVSHITILEAKGPGLMRIRMQCLVADEVNRNNRKYPGTLIERELGKYEQRIRERSAWGAAGHPESGKTDFSNVSHLVTRAWLDGKALMAEASILDTSAGRNLAACLRASGGSMPVSCRGFGTTSPRSADGRNFDEVNEDYQLEAVDLTLAPAGFADARVLSVTESLERGARLSASERRQRFLAGVDNDDATAGTAYSIQERLARLRAGISD